jgi:predicted MFS family arabinose efflux permease
MTALAPTLNQVIFWRFLHGLLLPPIFAVTIAYIGDEWPPGEANGVFGIYASASAVGGFLGRFVPGMLTGFVGWRGGFLALACGSVICLVMAALLLAPERKFVRATDLGTSLRQMLAHLRNPRLLATYAVGFGVLFNFIATFTYVSFYLAAPPYNLSASWLGAIFVVYLTGSVLTPWTGWAVGRFGRRRFVVRVIAVWAAGIALTLAPSLPLIIAGLAISAACGLICQAVSTGYVTVTAKAGRSSAVGLYVTSFYIGGSFGAALGGAAWTIGGWPACVAIVIAMLAIMSAIVFFAWARRVPAATSLPPIEPP